MAEQLCWSCSKACGGSDCPWANKLQPVEGWTATPSIVMSIIAELDNRHIEIMEFDINEVLPETVGHYTGLTDKNGVKIFEGDIVTGYFNHEKIVGYIFYGGNAQFFIQRDGIYGIGLDNSDCWLEVIGNIHDNPELLKGGGDNG